MKLKKLGEFGLIDLIKGMLRTPPGELGSIGDDCAVLPFNRQRFLLLTCDMLVEGVDFSGKDNPYLVGRKSLGCCLSDIAACGGLPRYAQISLGLPPSASVSKTEELYRGVISQAREFKVKIVGGDISRSNRLVIDTSLVGTVERNSLTSRRGAKRGDIIFVSDKLGGSRYGKHLKFKPRIKESRYLVRNYKINSMIDISDGLIQDLRHILKQSNKGAVLFKDLIPISAKARSFNEALYMGEDFELLFTLAPREARRLRKSRQSKKFYPIGEIVGVTRGLVLFDERAKRVKLQHSGFRHF